jgi:ABC-type oligopeptide transport system ATPase subunit
MEKLIEFKNVKKTYKIGEQNFNALDGVNFDIN